MNEIFQQLINGVKRAPFLVICIVIFVALCVADYFLWERQKTIVSRHEEVRRSGESMFSALSSHSRMVGELNTIQEALKQIDDNLIVEGDLAENQGYFFQLETLSRVHLTQLNQLSSQPSEDRPYKAVPFSMRATGTYSQLINFLRELESGPRQLRIRNFDFSRSDAKSNALTLGLTVELLAGP